MIVIKLLFYVLVIIYLVFFFLGNCDLHNATVLA